MSSEFTHCAILFKSSLEVNILRSFSLSFFLKTSRTANSGNPASIDFSTISFSVSGAIGRGSTVTSFPDLGLIEHNSTAAFQ